MGEEWWVIFSVSPKDPILLDWKDDRTLAVTDLNERLIFINKTLDTESFCRVLAHELTHCALYSYGPDYFDEETVCNIVSIFGPRIYELTKEFVYDSY